MASHRHLVRQSSSFIGEDIAPQNPDDPIDILPCDDDVDATISTVMTGTRGIGRNTSFFTRPAKPSILRKFFGPFFNKQTKTKRGLPMAKITHTSRKDMNGKIGWVHSYYKSRDRYAVTLLDDPAKVYFGLLDVEEVKTKMEFSGGKMKRVLSRGGLVKFKEACEVIEKEDGSVGEPQLVEEGSKSPESKARSKNGTNKSKSEDENTSKTKSTLQSDPQPKIKHSDPQTLFLPPTTLSHLTTIDIVKLHLEHVASNMMSKPSLARCLLSFVHFVEDAIFPAMRLESLVGFIVLLLPVTVARFYKEYILQMGNVMGQPRENQSPQGESLIIDGRGDGILADRWERSPSSIFEAVAPPMLTNLPLVPNNAIYHILAAPYLHPAEFSTLLLLLLGTNTIARFLLSEYKLVKRKAEAMAKAIHADRGNINQRGNHNKTDVKRDDEGELGVFTTYEMFEYRIDYYFSTSKWAKVALLLGFTFVLIAVGAGLLAVSLEDHSISNAVWIAWTYVADPGTHADAPAGFFIRLISFSITVGGMLIFALMIGIISEYIGDKVDELKKGKSRIIESDHTVILGWNDKSLAIIQQIALANESEGGGTIVVLADEDKDELESKLSSAIQSIENPLQLLGTEVIFRSGNPLMECELRRVSANTARSVVALSLDDLDPDEADSNMVRQVMALKAFDEFGGNDCHVVVEVNDVDNQELFALVAPDFAEVVVTHDIIGRLMLQCARCPGLACVLEEMMGFEGSEFYFEEWPELVGKTFYEITCRFDDAVPIGIKTSSGEVFINPENDHVIKEGDKILVLAEDNDSYEVNDGSYKIHGIKQVPEIVETEQKVEKIMFCGWRRDMADMIAQLDEYVQEGSELWLFNSVPAPKRAELLKDKGNKEELITNNLTICNVVGNPIIRRDLNRMHAVDDSGKPTGREITLDQFDSILILADAVAMENGANMMSCDSRSLSSLLIIQDIQKKLYDKKKSKDPNATPPCAPISEILDTRTKSLLKVANCHGYIMSNQIISSVMAQVSEDKDINIVLREILTADGSETYIRKVTRFVDLDEDRVLSFWDIALRARQRREVAVGYKPAELEFKDATHLIINPAEKFVPREWSPNDMIITFALD